MTTPLQAVFNQLNIPAQEQSKLRNIHNIVDFQSLKAQRTELDNGTLGEVDEAAQRILAVTIAYLLSIKSSGDPLPHFNKKRWIDFAIEHQEKPDVVSEEDDSMNVDEDNLEQDDEEDDDNGEYDKFSGQKNPMRRQKEQSNNQEVPNQTRTIENETKEVELTEQAFNPDDSALPPMDSDEDVIPARVKISQLTSVCFMERLFRKGRCYYATNKTGGRIIYGIKSFYSETAANCVEIVHYSKTFLGTGDCSEKFASILELEGCRYMQKTRVEVIHLGDLENDSLLPHPVELPKRIYDPRTNKKSQSFAFLYDRDNSNEIKVNREHTRVVEAFAGAGGMHLGFEDEGFETAMAIELDDAAVKTFEHNNPDVPTFEDGDVLKFIQKMDQDLEFREKVGPVEVIHTSSPCQGFSKANRNVEESERDAQNNSLSYTFYELLCVTGALIGTFENVEGMWSQKGMPYLKRLLVDCIELGYQVKVMLLRACNYGDPQVRPRLIIFAAKNFVRMPDDPVCTHGPGKRPYTTTKEVLDYLCTPVAKHLYPNMGNHTTGDCKDATKMTEQKGFSLLNPNGLAPGILASGKPIFHYAEKGPDGNLRSINVREAAALQSFPLDYEFLGTQTQKYKQVGNAVPCGLAGAIARSVRDSLRYMYLEELEEEGDDDVEAGEEEKKENSDN